MAEGYCNNCEDITEGQSRGSQFQCGVCKKYTNKSEDEKKARVNYKGNDYSAQYTVTSEKRVLTEAEIVENCQIDLTIWQIDRIEYGGNEAFRKDKQQDIKWKNGKIANGSFTKDSGKVVVAPLHSFRIFVSRRTEEIRNRLVVEEFIKEAKKFAPTYQKIKYKKEKDGHMFELGLPDLQLGRLVAAEDAGEDITPDLQIQQAVAVVDKLISYATNFNVSRIFFPVGNDFFDTNSAEMSTAHGTAMYDDVRWQRTYKLGCKFIVETIEKLMKIAPVDVLIIPGNHDQDKIFHLGEYLDAWFNKCKDVSVDNRPMKRKYYAFGKNLLGLTHGYYEKNSRLDSLMAYEVPQLWSASKNREWHLGDKHHKVDMVLKTNELENGVIVRILRSLASPSVWEFDKGLVGSLKAAEAFVWHPENGLIAQFTASK